MNYKALIVADLHLHHLPAWRYEWMWEFLSTLLSKQEAKTKLVLLGDVLELRDRVDSRVANQLFKLIGNWECGDVIWLTGQHDSYLPNRDTFEGLDDYALKKGKLKIVDREVWYDKDLGVFFVPYCRDEEDYRQMLKPIKNGSIIFTHLPVKEVIESFGGQDVCGISQKEFDRFSLVVSGDIHKYCKFGKVEYVGAPSQRDWRDKGVEGQIGWWVDREFSREETQHPVHIEVEKEEDIPDHGDCIIKMPRGLKISKELEDNVIAKIETIKTDFENVKVSYEKKDVDKLLSSYIDSNEVDKKEQAAYLEKGKSYFEE